MDLILIILIFVLLALMAFAIYVLLNIRSSLKDIYSELNTLEYKVNTKNLPQNKVINLNLFSEKLKKIFEGMKNIKLDDE
ncbi:hypothetical protein ACFL6G_03925 [candidate division KSB1 bacterium]